MSVKENKTIARTRTTAHDNFIFRFANVVPGPPLTPPFQLSVQFVFRGGVCSDISILRGGGGGVEPPLGINSF